VNSKLTGLIAGSLAIAGLVGGAYWLGVSSRDSDSKIHVSAQQSDVHKRASMAGQSANPHSQDMPRFTHFRVGNRNVKGMVAQGDIVWVGTSGGVLRYDLKTDDYKLFDVAGGHLLSNGVFHVSILDDKIAVGTYGGGLSLYDPAADKWKNYNIPDGLADQFVYDVQRVKNGDIWIATWSGVNHIKGGDLDNAAAWTTYNLENTKGGLPNDWVYGLEQGPDGAMWFATEQGVARFHQGKWENWQHDAGIGAAYEQVKDASKFGRDPGDASRHHARQKQEQGLGNVKGAYNPNYIVSLAMDQQGVVWAGTWGAGLSYFKNGAWHNLTTDQGLPSNHVFMLNVDKNGQLWAGTSHGLARLNADKKSFKSYTRRHGLFADNVFSMTNANDGSIWVGSFGGVARLFDVK